MSGPASSTMAPCSRPSTPLRAACGGSLRLVLTAPARAAFQNSGRDGETPFSRTKKRSAVSCCTKGEALDDFRARQHLFPKWRPCRDDGLGQAVSSQGGACAEARQPRASRLDRPFPFLTPSGGSPALTPYRSMTPAAEAPLPALTALVLAAPRPSHIRLPASLP